MLLVTLENIWHGPRAMESSTCTTVRSLPGTYDTLETLLRNFHSGFQVTKKISVRVWKTDRLVQPEEVRALSAINNKTAFANERIET